MTVGELIKALQEFDPNLEVMCEDWIEEQHRDPNPHLETFSKPVNPIADRPNFAYELVDKVFL